MADDAQNQETVNPRVVVRITPEMQFLLTQLAGRLRCTKKALHDDIWEAGILAMLGVSSEEVREARVATLPRTAERKDAKKLVSQMLIQR